jgi:hypothetical protein
MEPGNHILGEGLNTEPWLYGEATSTETSTHILGDQCPEGETADAALSSIEAGTYIQ